MWIINIVFEEITLKNFYSYGARPTTLNLIDSPLNLVVGTNGKGKSALIVDALFFALFGRPYRKIKLSNIINDINRKNCVVTLKFKVNNKDCKIVRGLKPNFIELYKGDEKEDDRSSTTLMQKEINNLIQLNPDTLRNVCILSANQSKPFLELTPAENRQVVENIFGIYIYSLMLQEVKSRHSNTKEKYRQLEKDLLFFSDIIKDQKNQVTKMNALKENFENDKKKKLERLEKERKTYADKLAHNEIRLEHYDIKKSNNKVYEENIVELLAVISDNESIIKWEEKEKKQLKESLCLITDNKECPFCSSELTEKHKEAEIKRLTGLHDGIKKKLRKLKKKDSDLDESLTILDESLNNSLKEIYKLDDIADESKELGLKISLLNADIKKTEEDSISEHISSIIDVDKIKGYVSKYKTTKEEKEENAETQQLEEKLKLILSDEGVKTLVIKKELPFLNTKINEYLRLLGFTINIEFDEGFNIILSNPRKKNYQYNNFSAGQKKRIDLAILMAFIDLAKRKNSVNTNLLIFDEVLDSSLDNEGINDFTAMIEKKMKEGSLDNVYIISHKPELVLPEARKILIEQVGEFSVIREDII